MSDGYAWLLEVCGDPDKADHAAHLDDDYAEPWCSHCQDGDGR